MLKRLRIQFIAIIMALLTLLLGSVIGLIYHFTRQSLVKESRDMMDSLAASPFQLARLDEASNRVNLPYCMLQVNKYGEILATNGGYYDLSDEDFLQELIAVTYSSTDMQGEIPQYNLRYSRYLLQNGQRLVFVDTTSEQATLHALLRSSLLLGVAALLLFFGVSLLLARWTVRPVESAWQQQKQFVADASHELKTPLTSISGIAEIIRNGIVKPEDIPHFAGKIYDESQRLITLIGDIIKLSRLDENQVPMERETVDMLEMARDVVQQLSSVARKNGVTLVANGTHGQVQGVRQVLGEMVYNLCENAVKYNRAGGRVWVDVQQVADHVVLRVKDTGIGIPAAEQGRIFERFYRVDKSHSKAVGGTGLGLSIVKHGAALHHATISVSSEPEQGTEITLTFPAA